MTKKKTPEKLTYLLQEDKAQEMLELYIALDSMLDEASETFDIDLSTLRDLRHQTWRLKETFSFKPQKHDEYADRPAHWKEYVLPNDERAWYYNAKH
jgi:DNA-directed RNA polymerase